MAGAVSNNNSRYVQPPPSSSPQFQMPRPTPGFYGCSTNPRFLQGSTSIAPLSSQSPCIPMQSYVLSNPAMLLQQAPQFPSTNQVAPHNSHLTQPPGVFSPFLVSWPTEGAMARGQQTILFPSNPSPHGTIQPPTMEDLRRAHDLMAMVWFLGSSMHHQLPPPTQGGRSLGPSTLLGLPPAHSDPIPPPLLPNNTAGTPTVSTPLHAQPKLFEHGVRKPISFWIPIVLRDRGKIAEIFRVSF